jgi:hypothetical protein
MTYDELLAKINNLPEAIGLAEFKVRHDALRAVVELHKPFTPEFGGGIDYCFRDDEPYPCKTIQAIERELSNG